MAWRPPRAISADLGLGRVPAELDLAAELALVVLRLVGELDVAKAEVHRLADLAAGIRADVGGADEDLLHRAFQEVELAFAGLAHGDHRLLEVLARRAVLRDHRRRLV